MMIRLLENHNKGRSLVTTMVRYLYLFCMVRVRKAQPVLEVDSHGWVGGWVGIGTNEVITCPVVLSSQLYSFGGIIACE